MNNKDKIEDTKFENLSEIESIVEKIASKQGSCGFEAIYDSDKISEKFFIVKIKDNRNIYF